MLVAIVNILPQILVVWVLAIIFGWQFTPFAIGAVLLGLIIIAILSTGMGLLFGAVNVAFRDAQSFVEIIIMCAVWASPVMYQWTMVQQELGPIWFDIYRLNPLTPAVELFHYGFWLPLDPKGGEPIPGLATYSLYGLVVALVMLLIGQFVFRKMEGRFAQEL
jgi:ABC-2 type transport system permease protein